MNDMTTPPAAPKAKRLLPAGFGGTTKGTRRGNGAGHGGPAKGAGKPAGQKREAFEPGNQVAAVKASEG